jgi:hypothetical protein
MVRGEAYLRLHWFGGRHDWSRPDAQPAMYARCCWPSQVISSVSLIELLR